MSSTPSVSSRTDAANTSRRRRLVRSALLAPLVGMLALGALALPAHASETAKLSASLSPDRLGADTTVAFTFDIGTTNGAVPSPATSVGMHLPAGLGLFTSNLGQSFCQPAALKANGVSGCSPNALMGRGNGTVEVAKGSERLEVPVNLTIVMGPAHEEHTGLLFYAEGKSAIIAELVFPTVVLGAANPFSSLIDTSIPPIHSLPEAPDAALIRMHVTIGGPGLRYTKHVRGKTVHYTPRGMAVPERCPRNGFPFAATFTFEDHTTATATTRVPCPKGHR